MNKTLLFVAFILASVLTTAQTTLIPSYRIKANGERQEILLKSDNFYVTPSSLTYYLTENGEKLSANPENTKEIGHNDKSLILKSVFTTLDETSDNPTQLVLNSSNNRSKKQIFLKQLIIGSISLYKHSTSDNTRFYIQNGENAIDFLIYKKFLDNDGMTMREEKVFQKQLFEIAKCPKDDYADAANVNYEEKDLIQEIKNYHNCYDLEYQEIKPSQNYKRMSYSSQIGMTSNSAKLEFNENTNRTDANFDFPASIYFNVQAEYRLDQINDKWSLIGGLSYYSESIGEASYKTRVGSVLERDQMATMDVTFISPRFGIRHYMYLGNSKFRFYPQVDIALEMPISGSQLSYTPNDNVIVNAAYDEPSVSGNFSLGLEFNRKVSAELIIPFGNFYRFSNGTTQSNNSRITFALGYRIF